jgi:hypothetical protein
MMTALIIVGAIFGWLLCGAIGVAIQTWWNKTRCSLGEIFLFSLFGVFAIFASLVEIVCDTTSSLSKMCEIDWNKTILDFSKKK